jgi:hypothetical protein
MRDTVPEIALYLLFGLGFVTAGGLWGFSLGYFKGWRAALRSRR